MNTLIVVDEPTQWPLSMGAEVVAAREYLTDPRFVGMRRVRVFNLCRSYAYQSVGYYVSLLAAARGHKPLPSITTMQDLRQSSVIRIVSDNLEQQLQRALSPIKSDRFELSIYFGRNLAQRYDPLCQALFDHFPVPFLRAELVRLDRWRLQSLRPIASAQIPESHQAFVIEQAHRFFRRPRLRRLPKPRYDIAILFDPEQTDSPSDPLAIQHFVRAAERMNMAAWVISKQDFARTAEFDALFIRETTSVNHHTYRFARRADAEGLVVIDDPESIVRCSNKVYQAELFERHGIPAPKTLVVHRDNRATVGERLGFPCVLKRPDSSFSAGVVKAANEDELRQRLGEFFRGSELVIAQALMPSEFDWRVGVLDGRALFVCKYFMARGHWQIQRAEAKGARRYGKTEALAIDQAPPRVVEVAVRAANLIGRGLYGVDLKEVDGRVVVIEVNDNPNIEAGFEDMLLKDELYDAVMRCFYERLEAGSAAVAESR